MRLLGLFIATAGALAGCGNDPATGSTLVEGQVVENQSRQPVAGATVQVYQHGSGGGYGAVGSRVSDLLDLPQTRQLSIRS